MVLGVKSAAMMAHGPQLKKLSTRMTSSESQYESSLQLLLVISISFKTGKLPLSSASSLLSSILMIGKSGAESHLTFGKENLLEQTGRGFKGLLGKIKLLAIYSPVFCLTAAFRLTALAIILTADSQLVLVLLPLSVLAPFVVLFLMKLCRLKDLSVVEIAEAVLGEQTTHSLWGGWGRERSRQLQLGMTIYLLLLHSTFLALFLSGVVLDVHFFGPLERNEGMTVAAIVSLITGWLSWVVLMSLQNLCVRVCASSASQ